MLFTYFFVLQEQNPTMPIDRVLHLLYPYTNFLTKDGQNMVQNLMKSFNIEKTTSNENIPTSQSLQINEMRIGDDNDYVPTNYHQQIVNELVESIKIHDICLIGARGSGKSTLIKQLANRLSLDIEPIMLYQVYHVTS